MSTNEEFDKIARILSNGGSFVMHKNDAGRLREAAKAGNKPDIFNDVKIYVDKTGVIEEGRPVVAVLGGYKEELSFRDTFDNGLYGKERLNILRGEFKSKTKG